MNWTKDYIIPGDVFADETVLCMRCGTQISGLSYKEMPNVNNPKELVKVAHKKRFGNLRQMGVLMIRRGREQVVYLQVCQDCIKEIDPARDTDEIVKQIRRAMQIEARWAGMPEEAVEGIARQFSDARVIRKLNSEELIEGKILEVV